MFCGCMAIVRRVLGEPAVSAETAWTDLNEALQTTVPPCAGHASFTADFRAEVVAEWCASICARCPVADLCGAYAEAAKVESGFWAGVDHGRKRPPRE